MRARRVAGCRPVAAARRQAAADAVEPPRPARPPIRCSTGWGSGRGSTSCTRSTACRTIRRSSSATCDYGGQVNAAFRCRQRLRHAVPPGEVRGRRTRPARQLRDRAGGGRLITLYPSIDLRDGKVVRLAQGDYDAGDGLRRRPSRVAESFCAQGATWIHVVDLDAARTGDPPNRDVVAAIVDAVGGRAQVQAGGGVRNVPTPRGTGRRRRGPGRHGLGGGRRPASGRSGRGHRAGRRRARSPRRAAGRPRLDRTDRRGARRRARPLPGRPPRSSSPTSAVTGCWAARTSTGWRGRRGGDATSRSSPAAASRRSTTCGALAAIDGLHGIIAGRALYEGRFSVADAVGAWREPGLA